MPTVPGQQKEGCLGAQCVESEHREGMEQIAAIQSGRNSGGRAALSGLVEQIEESQTGSQTEQLSVAIITAEVKGEDQEHGGEAVVHVEQECQRTGREQGNGRHGRAVLCFGQTLIAIDAPALRKKVRSTLPPQTPVARVKGAWERRAHAPSRMR